MRYIAGLAISLIAAPAAAVWREASSEHFVIYSQDSAEGLRAYAERLERFDRLLRRNQSVAPQSRAADRLTIYALPTTSSLMRVVGSRGQTAAGIYRGSVTGSIALTSRDGGQGKRDMTPQIILLHEYAHHFMLRYFPATYPIWFVEGYAEFASTMRFDPNGDVAVGLPVMHRGIEFNYTHQVPLADMMTGKAKYDALLEAKGWLLTHYLTFEPRRRGQLGAFLKSLNNGNSAVDAARETFGDLRKLDGELGAYMRGGSFSYLTLKSAELPPGAITIRELGPGEAAIMPVQMNSRFGVGRREAMRLVKQARTIAAAYPEDPAVQCALAEAEDDAGNPAETEAIADRVLARDDKALCGLVFKGRSLMARAIAARAAPEDRMWRDARSWFVRANRAYPEHPWPMFLYYLSYRIAKVLPTENARIALFGALNRAPQDVTVRFAAVVQLLRDGDAKQAQAALGPLIGGNHGADTTALSALYTRIGKEDPKALADELENGPAKPAPPKPDAP